MKVLYMSILIQTLHYQSGVACAPKWSNGVESREGRGQSESITATTTTVLDLKCIPTVGAALLQFGCM